MKKLTHEQELIFKIRAKYELKKIKRRPHNKNRTISKLDEILILAPAVMDLYKPQYYSKVIAFIESIRRHIPRKKIKLCFRDTKHITAAAGLLFLAEVDRLVKRFGSRKIKCIRPSIQRDRFGRESRRVEAALTQIGFFRLLGMKESSFPKEPSVDCWMVDSGIAADGAIAGSLLQKVTQNTSGIPTKTLYRGCIEAISNCVEHAYTGVRMDGLRIDDKRWWMFVAIVEKKLVVVVCDLGVGIPNTVSKTQEKSILEKLFATFGFVASTDCEWIKTATLVKETRTNLSYRGKGGGDLRSLLQYNDSASLMIFSNRGNYRCRNVMKSGKRKPIERLYDNKRSMLGTIIQWSIDLE